MAFISHIPGTQPLPKVHRSPRALGFAVLGAHEGRTLLLAAQRCVHAYPVAVCDLEREKLDAALAAAPGILATTSYDEILRHPEVKIVAVYTPDAMHGEHVERALLAGKHVICTKPLVNSVTDAARLRRASMTATTRLLVGQSTRFFEPFLRQRQAFDRGEFGAVELADAHYIHRMDWYYDKSPWAARDTDWVFLGLSHPIDLLRWYLGPIRTVSAFAASSALARQRGVASSDIYIVNVVSEAGAVGRAMGHYGVRELPTARNCIELVLYGSEGTSLAQYHDMRLIRTTPAPPSAPPRPGFDPGAMGEITEDYLYAGRHYYFGSEVHGMHYGEFANYLDAFASAIVSGAPCSPDLVEGLETFGIMESARRSAARGQPVQVGEVLAEIGMPVAR